MDLTGACQCQYLPILEVLLSRLWLSLFSYVLLEYSKLEGVRVPTESGIS